MAYQIPDQIPSMAALEPKSKVQDYNYPPKPLAKTAAPGPAVRCRQQRSGNRPREEVTAVSTPGEMTCQLVMASAVMAIGCWKLAVIRRPATVELRQPIGMTSIITRIRPQKTQPARPLTSLRLTVGQLQPSPESRLLQQRPSQRKLLFQSRVSLCPSCRREACC